LFLDQNDWDHMTLTLERVRNHLTKRSPQRIREPGAIEAAVAIVLVEIPLGLELLLIKRAEHEHDPWSGQMGLPGGRRDPGDPSLLHTACRETFEETAVRLEAPQLLGELDDLHPRTPVLPPIVVRPYVFGMTERPLVRTNLEVDLHLWVTLDEVRNSAAQSELEVRGRALEVPSYVLGPHIVWGMTHRIIKPIIDLAG